jgi:hypothetical protein
MEASDMKAKHIILYSLLLGLALTVASTMRFETDSVPDLVMTRYGFPFSWLHHQTVSIAGAVEVWTIHWFFLGGDVIAWFVMSAIIVSVVTRYRT